MVIMYSRARGVNCEKKQLLPLNKGEYHHEAIRICTHDDKPIWSLMKNYINNLKPNEEFNRFDLLSSVYIPPVAIRIKQSQTTVDQYRRAITIVNCVERIGWGKYRKLKNIPPNLAISKLKKHVYGNNWKTWFIPIEDI